MPTTPTIDASLRAQIGEFLVRVDSLVRRAALAAVQDAMAEGAPAPTRRGRRRRGARKTRRASSARKATRAQKSARPARSRRVRRSPADLDKLASTILAYVRSHPGSRLEEIGRGLKRPTSVLKRPAARLLADGQVRTEGQKRGTRYFAGGGRARRKRAKARRKAARTARRGGARRKGGKKARRPAARTVRPARRRASRLRPAPEAVPRAATKRGKRGGRRRKARAHVAKPVPQRTFRPAARREKRGRMKEAQAAAALKQSPGPAIVADLPEPTTSAASVE